jgi:hypothetical protein
MEKIIVHAFEKDGIIYPPVEAECENCVFSESKIIGFNFGGEVIRCYCYFIKEFVDDQPPCAKHELDILKISDEQEEELWRLEEADELDVDEDDEAKKREAEAFHSL